jgi:hypothetical protein
MTSRWSSRARGAAIVFVASLALPLSSAGAYHLPQQHTAASDDQSLRGFRAALEKYGTLRARIREEVPPLQVTPNAQEIVQRSDAIARAITRGRPGVRQGAFFDAAAAPAIRRRLADALKSTDAAGIMALLEEDMTEFTAVRVHARFPVNAVGYVLPTMPATLLHALPVLPPQLEYRFIGRTLILRDIDAAMIVDFLPSALPAR